MNITQTTDVIIVGSGVIGCATAYFLRKAGFDKQLTAAGVAWLLNSALRLVPQLGESMPVRM